MFHIHIWKATSWFWNVDENHTSTGSSCSVLQHSSTSAVKIFGLLKGFLSARCRYHECFHSLAVHGLHELGLLYSVNRWAPLFFSSSGPNRRSLMTFGSLLITQTYPWLWQDQDPDRPCTKLFLPSIILAISSLNYSIRHCCTGVGGNSFVKAATVSALCIIGRFVWTLNLTGAWPLLAAELSTESRDTNCNSGQSTKRKNDQRSETQK